MTDLYVDYSFARPDPNLIKAHGYTGVMRYLAPPSGGAKILSKAEAQTLLDAELGVGVVWESTSSRAAAGQAAGQADAAAAEAQADALGMPGNVPIFYAVDFDADGPTVAPYFTGVNNWARRPVGVYGSARVVEHIILTGLATYGWQTGAWSHGVVSPLAHLYQRVGTTPISNTDVNEVRKPFPMWGLGDADMPLNADDEAKIATQVNNAVITILRSDEVRAILADRVWNASLGPNTGIGPATAQRWLTDTRVLAGKTPDATVDVAALAAALAADQAFIDKLAAAVTAQKYAGTMTLEPVQP